MPKTLHVALREFNSTVLTKGFIVGMLMTPVILIVALGAVMVLSNLEGPRAAGEVALIDRTGGLVAPGVEYRFSEEGIAAERARQAEALDHTLDRAADAFGADDKHRDMVRGISRSAAARANGSIPVLSLRLLPEDADPEAEKAPVKAARVRDPSAASRAPDAPPQRLALAVVPPEAISTGDDGRYGPYEVYFADKLDFQIQQEISRRISAAIVDARIRSDPRTQAGSLAPEDIRALLKEPEVTGRTVTADGEKPVSKLTEITGFLIPVAFMLLLMMSVMTGGQYLLTTTIEEKSSRVMEVLLSAISPMQLMVGKILGQMAVGLLILTVYSGAGVASLLILSLDHLLNPMNVVYLLVFFLIAFFLIASFMAAIGSAVTEMREAQTLMTPVMAAMVLPWILVMPISRAPNAGWVTALSFIPGLNPFVMMIRLAGSEPIPAWQIPATIAVGVISAMIAAWAAAKVFRVGILMYGKPPNFRTLWRWIRMA